MTALFLGAPDVSAIFSVFLRITLQSLSGLGCSLLGIGSLAAAILGVGAGPHPSVSLSLRRAFLCVEPHPSTQSCPQAWRFHVPASPEGEPLVSAGTRGRVGALLQGLVEGDLLLLVQTLGPSSWPLPAAPGAVRACAVSGSLSKQGCVLPVLPPSCS